MAGVPPNSLRQTELPEYGMNGPFGGIQSQMPPGRIGNLGFLDANNIILRHGIAGVRPQLYLQGASANAPLDNPIVGVADFFNAVGTRIQVCMTTDKVYQWSPSGGDWTALTGTLTGSATQIFTSAVVADKLLFCQGKDVVQVFDGISTSFASASGSAVPARYLCEFEFYLLAGYTIEAGPTTQIQRVRWTAPGNTADWTSYLAGQNDLLNDLGPITGMCKLYQQAFAFQQWGITQIIPTGQGVNPFDFFPMGSKARGNICPYSLAVSGLDIACYVGKNNIYLFDGTESIPIGDAPQQNGGYRTGARSRIFADIFVTGSSQVYGYISTSIYGVDYGAYWLVIPGAQVIWIYNFEEANWTRWTFAVVPNVVGDFFIGEAPTIAQLLGPILAQTWSPSNLVSSATFDGVFFGLSNNTPAYMDFTGISEQPWNITSGQWYFGDFRHKKTVSSVRLVFTDSQANLSFTLTLTNNKGNSIVLNVGPVGTGSGATTEVVVPVSGVDTLTGQQITKLNGRWIQWQLSGGTLDIGQLPGQIAGLSGNIAGLSGAYSNLQLEEITPIYDVSGENRAGANS